MKAIFLLLSFLSLTLIYSQNADFNLNAIDSKIPYFNEDATALSTATWSTLPPTPHIVSRSCCAYILRNDTGYIYQFGGGAGAQFTNVARLNLKTNTWTNNVTVIPFQISAGYAVPDGDSAIYVFGGNSPTLGKTLKLNIVTNTWTTLPDMPTPSTDMLCVKYQDTIVYAILGGDGLFGTGVNNAVRVFKMRSGTWTALPAFPMSKSMVGGGIYADTIIVAAGWTGSTGTTTAHKGVINPTTLAITWTAIAAYPPGGMTRTASHLVQKPGQGAGIVISCGAPNGGTPLSGATTLWNFCTQSWQTMTPNSVVRSNMRGCGAGDSVFYVISGYNGSAGISNCDKLTFSLIDGTCAIVVGTTQGSKIPTGYELKQNYPNPFNPTTTISFSVPKTGKVNIVLMDVLGKEVLTIVNDYRAAGNYEIEVDGSALASGVYFYKMTSGSFADTKKLVLVK